jgi:TetR/AcrR family transcriptional regulator, transcriptional repressor for nem operon
MADAPVDDRSRRLTARGAATRKRIVVAAADLMRAQGVAGTTFDEISAASGTSKSQLYHHFPDKPSLARAVVELRAETVLDANQQQLRRLNSLAGLRRWRDFIVQNVAMRDGVYGCMLGSLASELADRDEQARTSLQRHFEAWRQLFIDGLTRMIDNDTLRPEADPDQLATAIMAALQGGYLLSQTAHDSTPMQVALDMAINHVQDFATTPTLG